MSKGNQDKRTDTEWAEFERLVARVENHLAGDDTNVKSPDHIKDKDTGTSREVDASIRYTIGSTPILITIECRKRNAAQDITWIEQLATKKINIGADKTIAVASKGFSKEAIKKAKHLGIELRTINKIKDNEISSLIGTNEAEIYRSKLITSLFYIEFDLGEEENLDVTISASVVQKLTEQGIEAKLIENCKTGKMVSLREMFNLALNEVYNNPAQPKKKVIIPPKESAAFGGDVFTIFCIQLLKEKEEGKFQLSFAFENPLYCIDTINGNFQINKIETILHVKLVKEILSNQYIQYKTGNGELIKNIGEIKVAMNGNDVIINWSSEDIEDKNE